MTVQFSDEFINGLFEGANFGEETNNCVKAKRKQLVETLRAQVSGYWSSSTAYSIVVNAGFLHVDKSEVHKKLTALGEAFMKAEKVWHIPHNHRAITADQLKEAKRFIADECEHQSIFVKRIVDCRREFAFATCWVSGPNADYQYLPLTQSLIASYKAGPTFSKPIPENVNAVPKELQGENEKVTKRDNILIATVIQWLGSNVGWGFLEQALKTAGYKLTRIEDEDNA